MWRSLAPGTLQSGTTRTQQGTGGRERLPGLLPTHASCDGGWHAGALGVYARAVSASWPLRRQRGGRYFIYRPPYGQTRAVQSASHGQEGPNTDCSEARKRTELKSGSPRGCLAGLRRTPEPLHARASSRSSFDLAGKLDRFLNSFCMADWMRAETWSVEPAFIRSASPVSKFLLDL